jgi:hypothetical protein
MEKYCLHGLATGGSNIQHMCCACWIPKTTNTHSEHLLLFHSYNDSTYVPQYYSICTLPILLLMQTSLYLEQFMFCAGALALSCLLALFESYVLCCMSQVV